jgi:hypothetical protein
MQPPFLKYRSRGKTYRSTRATGWQNFLNLKRLWNGSKKAGIKVGEHFAENNVWAKGAIAKREERLRKHGALAKRHEVQQQSADRLSRRCQRRWEITIIETKRTQNHANYHRPA